MAFALFIDGVRGLDGAGAQADVLEMRNGHDGNADDGQNGLLHPMRDQQCGHHEGKTKTTGQQWRTLPVAAKPAAQAKSGKEYGQAKADLMPRRMLQQMPTTGEACDQHNARHAMHKAKRGQAKRQSVGPDAIKAESLGQLR